MAGRETAAPLAGVTTRPFAGFLDEAAEELKRRAGTWSVAFLVLSTISLGNAGPRQVLLQVGAWIPILIVTLGVGGALFFYTWSLLCHSHPTLVPKDIKRASFGPGILQLELMDGSVECHLGGAASASVVEDQSLEVILRDGRKLVIPVNAFSNEEELLTAAACLSMQSVLIGKAA